MSKHTNNNPDLAEVIPIDATQRRHLKEKRTREASRNAAQLLLEKMGGGVRNGESAVAARRRGGKRLALGAAAVVTAVVAPQVIDSSRDLMQEASEKVQEGYIEPLEKWQESGDIAEGMVAVQTKASYDSPTDFARQIAGKKVSNDTMNHLISVINAQSNIQGYPGVEAGEQFVLPEADLSTGKNLTTYVIPLTPDEK